jgi:hypothetical protein
MAKATKIAVDFDGTIVKHEYPNIGDPAPGAFRWLNVWQVKLNVKLILWTMRDKAELQQAIDFCKEHGVTFDAINAGIGDRSWTSSPKAHAHIYVDDAAFGCPLIVPEEGRPYVDWSIVGPMIAHKVAPADWILEKYPDMAKYG